MATFNQSKFVFFSIALCLVIYYEIQAQNEVAIGSSTTKSNAILWLNGNGSQGLILPVVTNKSAVSNPDKGMIVYDDSDNKVWYRSNTAWVEVGGGGTSTSSLNLQLSGNSLELRDGTTVLNAVPIASGAQAAGSFLVFQSGSWQFATLSGDVTGVNGALVVNGIKGKTVANLPSSTQALVYNPTANSGAGGWVFQALAGGGTVTNVSGTPPLNVTNPTTTPVISMTNGGITNTLIANDAITTSKIMDGTITDADLANTTITAGKLAQSSAANGQVLKWNGTAWAPAADDAGVSSTLTSANIFVGNASNVAAGVALSGDATLSNTGALTIANNAITTAKINANAVDATKLANNAVTSAKILDGTIADADIANTTITVGKLAQSGATAGQILKWNGTAWAPAADDAGISSTLTSANILVGNASNVATGVTMSGDATLSNTGAVTIANNAVTSAKILDGSIVDSDIANATITAGKLAQSSATAGQVLKWNGTAWAPAADDGISSTLTSANILVGNASHVATGVAMSGDATLSNTGALAIANDAVTSSKIADGTITNADVNSGAAIDGSKINPQFGNQIVTTTGGLGLGTTIPGNLFEADGTEGKVSFHPYFPNVGTSLVGTFFAKSNKGAQVRFEGPASGYVDVGQDAAGNFVVENGSDEKILSVNPSGAIGVGTVPDFGAVGKVLTSQGPGAAASWATVGSPFSTLNRVPKGDGSGLVASLIYDDGTNVGIGTTTPLTKLHVATGNINIDINQAYKVGDENVLSRTGSNVTVGSNLVTDLALLAGTEKMRIKTSGNVGIGSTNPTSLLHAYGSTDPLIKLDGPAGEQSVLGFATAGTNKWSWYIPGGGNDLRLWHYTSPSQNYLSFDGSNGNISIAPTSGDVGIRTLTPRGAFDVASTGDIYLANNTITGTSQSLYMPGHIFIAPYNATNISYLQARRSDNSGTTALRIRTYNAGSLTEAMHIEGNGRVGIGTTTPLGRLHVENADWDLNPLYVGSMAASAGATVRFYTPDGGGRTYDIIGATGSGAIPGAGAFGIWDNTAGIYRMVITPTGNVGFGTTSPTSKVHVATGSQRGIWASSSLASNIDGAVYGSHSAGPIAALATQNNGIYAKSIVSSGAGVFGDNDGSNTVGYAGYFFGRVHVTGAFSKGSGTFKIDHPVDPENKYLLHSFVESPDMMNVYNGNITTDESGLAYVKLPDYFEALNKDFRYQLTVLGEFAQAIVAKKVENNSFAIKTDKPNVEVSWQVTGIRKDPYAEKNRIVAEVEKTDPEKGKYLHPEAYGLSPERGINYDSKKQNQ